MFFIAKLRKLEEIISDFKGYKKSRWLKDFEMSIYSIRLDQLEEYKDKHWREEI